MCMYSNNCFGTVQTALVSSALGKKYLQLIMTRKSNSNAKSLEKENDYLKKKKSLKEEFRRIATALEFRESSRGGLKQHPEIEKYKPKSTSHNEIRV